MISAIVASSCSCGTTASTSPIAERFVGVDRLSGEHQPLREARADAPGRALRAAEAGVDADAGLGKRERGLRRRDDRVARERELDAAAEREAVHARDDRLGARLDRRAAAPGRARVNATMRSMSPASMLRTKKRMSAPATKALPLPAIDDARDRRIGGQRVERALELRDDRPR